MSFQAAGLAVARLNIKSHTLDLESLMHDVTGTSHGGQRARIAGVEDAKGTVNCDTDLDAPPWLAASPNIRNGVSGLCLFWIANPTTKPNGYFQVPVIIPKVHYETGVESYVKHSFDVLLNIIATATATFVYPSL